MTLAVVVSLLATPALADHWVELKADYAFGDGSSQDSFSKVSVDYSVPSFSAQVYIPSVDVEGGPYREAGFLAKSSTVYIYNSVESADLSYVYNRVAGGSIKSKGSYHIRSTGLQGFGVIGDWLVGG